MDMDNIKLALQSYNYGNGYLEWAKARGGYTLANAAEFSDTMAKKMGWSSYGKVPKFSLCSDGVLWFKSKSKWQNGGSAPAPGMIIFSDWDYDGISDHVGIVVKCEGGRVYTIEGNSSDQVRQRNYTVDYSSIMGYGVIN